ncbi:MAG: protease HtpX [Gammaproteobacteria bacterium]|nr:protease HtpX [Gammaproteobacteria bacterium]
MKRLMLFLGTNIAVLVVISAALKVFGLERFLYQQGVDMNLGGLLAASAVIGMTGSVVSLLMSKSVAKMSTGARVIAQPGTPLEQWLVATVARLAQAAGIGMPEVAVYESADVNAFATGWNRNNALVAVSTGLLYSMDRAEAEAVLGHEVSHVANGDMVTLALIQGVVNTFVVFLARIVAMFVDRALSRGEERQGYGPGYWVTTMVMQVLFGIIASIIVMWFSRQREFRADAGGASLAGRGAMIAALERLQALHRPSELPRQMAAFGISGNLRQGLMRLFMTHPPLEERIAALRQAAGSDERRAA